jgi:transposase
MSYSIDLRKRVVDYVENGGRIAKAAVLFKVGIVLHSNDNQAFGSIDKLALYS